MIYPPPLLRSLKIQAAQSGKSLKALLNKLIVRAMAMPASPPLADAPELPVLSRLTNAKVTAKVKLVTLANNTDLETAQLQDDLDKLRRSGFVQWPQEVPMTCWT